MQKGLKVLIFCLMIAVTLSDTAIVTYHLYTKYDKLTTVACSDGKNGIMSWGYNDLSLLFPYVTAWQPSGWNSTQCGSCAKIMWNGRFVYVTVIDQCGMINSAYSHFDMSKEAFYKLFGDIGIARGSMTANFSIVASKYCPGNRKGVISSTPIRLENSYEQQNVQGQNQQINPLWVRKESGTSTNLKSEPIQQNNQPYNIQSSQNSNPLWVKGTGSSESSAESVGSGQAVSSQASDLPLTQWGGIDYDRQNEINEQSVSAQDSDSPLTQWGGIDYDKQNEINEQAVSSQSSDLPLTQFGGIDYDKLNEINERK